MMADDEEPLDHLLDDPDLEQFLNEIVSERNISRRTNWRYRSMSLTQRDVAVWILFNNLHFNIFTCCSALP
jgi:hypothetical protein